MSVDTVVVLSVDALNAAHLPFHGYERNTAPFLSELAADNLVFENCYSVSSHTREAMPTMLSGRYPFRAIDDRYRLDCPTVASHLDGRTGMFHSNPFISRAYGYGGDFDEFDDDLWLSRNRLLTLGKRLFDKITNRHYARADVINRRARRWVEEQPDEGVLLWNHYMDVHAPYYPPREYRTQYGVEGVSKRRSQLLLHKGKRARGRVTANERRTLVDLYDGEIRYVDDQIQRFVEWLRAADLYDDTLLVVTSDHGEGFGKEGFYEHPRRLTDGLLHVPMILAGAGVPARQVRTPVSVRDIPATVLDAFGIDAESVPGASLTDRANASHDGFVFAQVTHKWASTLQFYARGSNGRATATFDSGTGDLSFEGDDPAVEALVEHVAEYAYEDLDREEAAPEDPEVVQRLRALGYIE